MVVVVSNDLVDTGVGGAEAVGPVATYGGDALLFSRGERLRSVFLLLAGQVALSRHLRDGKELVLHRAQGPCILAEASLYAEHYHCDAVVLTTCEVRKVTKSSFLSRLKEDADMAAGWSAHLAHRLQSARQFSEIMRMKKVSERLDAWLDLHGGKLPPKGQWKGVAAQIGVSAEALYRELGIREP